MPDQLAPASGMQVDALGRVTYDFDGHVHAVGVDLDLAAANVDDPDHQLRWLRASDRERLAWLYGWEAGDGAELGAVVADDSGDEARVVLDPTDVWAQAGSWIAHVIKDDRTSSFVQVEGINVAGNRGLRVTKGYQANVNVAPGANQYVTVSLGLVPDVGSFFHVIGQLDNTDPGAAWMDRVSWCVTDFDGSSIEFSFACNSDAGGNAVGAFYFRLLTGD